MKRDAKGRDYWQDYWRRNADPSCHKCKGDGEIWVYTKTGYFVDIRACECVQKNIDGARKAGVRT